MTAKTSAARAIALVGPSGSGKTTLMEALLFASGVLERQGTTAAGTTVGDASPRKAALVQPILTELDRLQVPRAIFVNKVDQARGEVRELLSALQPVSRLPLVARQLPIWGGEHITGFVDLALERAFVYRQG